MSRKLMVEIVGDASSLEHAFGRSAAAAEGFGSKLGGLAKAALLVGGAAAVGGLAYALESSVKAAIAGQESQAKLDAALKATNQSVEKMTPALERAQSASRQLGFTNDESRTALAKLEVATGNTKKSITDLGVAEDIARFKHTDLTNASQMLAMAMTGSQRAAKQLGITVIPLTTNVDALKASHEDLTTAVGKADLAQAKLADKMATGNAVIDTVSQKLHGQAQAYADTAAGGMAQFHAQLNNVQEKLGNALLPVMERTLAWVNQHWPQISAVVTTALHGVSAAIEFVKPYFQDIVAATGRVVAYVQAHWPQISAEITRVMNTVRSIISGVVTVAEALWRRFGSTITSIVRTDFATVEAVIRNAAGIISGVFALIGDLIHGRWSNIWGDLKKIVSNAIEGVVAVVRGAASVVLQAAFAIGRAIVSGVLGGVGGLFGALKSKLEGTLKSVLSSLNPFSPVSHGGEIYIGRPLMQGAIDAIGADVPRLREALEQAIEKATSTVRMNVPKTTGTQYRNSSGAPLSDWLTEKSIQDSLAANPNASTGAYEGPVMGDQYGSGAGLSVSIPVILDGQQVGLAVQTWAARDLMRGGAGVPG